MTDYRKEYGEFSLTVPERFSFPLDVFDGWGERTALFWTDGTAEQAFSFNELKALSSKGAGAFKKMGIKKGDKVLVMLPNIPEWWEVLLSLMRLNAIPIPATTLLTSKDIEYRLRATGITAVIVTEEDLPKVLEAAKTSASVPLLITVGEGGGPLNYAVERDKAQAFVGERSFSDEPSMIYFTSGTTGPPKMVVHTQASYPLAHLITGRYWLDLRPGDVHWNISDTGWAKAAWSSLFGPWHMGATIFSFYRKGKFDPLLTIKILESYPVTTFCGPPTAYRMMVKEHRGRLNAGTRHYVAAGEPLNKEIIDLWKEKTGRHIYDGYGQT